MLQDYQGLAIRLTDERLAHILEHPYRIYLGTRVGDKYLCVVVKVAADHAFVLTAYLTDRVRKGVLIWPRRD